VYGQVFPSVFSAAMGDGSVRPFQTDLPVEKLRAWITRTGKERPVDD
jgi:hypothetical protein